MLKTKAALLKEAYNIGLVERELVCSWVIQ
ncbi:MAG: hypothetical protein JG781_938 [Peptococcaceae bacterium]|jgi:hypothetical protein|nr:hypothetical protein [Peptococcaceae bacterium]